LYIILTIFIKEKILFMKLIIKKKKKKKKKKKNYNILINIKIIFEVFKSNAKF